MAPPKHTLPFLRKQMAEIKKHGSVYGASRVMGIPAATLQNQVIAAKREGLPDPFGGKPPKGGRVATPVAPPTDTERREMIALRAENSRLRKQVEASDHRAIEADRFRCLSAELHDAPLAMPDWAVRVPAGEDSPGVPMLFLSDWHIGETVDPAQMHGANAFNAEIAEARVKRVIDRTLYLAFQHVRAPKYPGIVVILGGDFVSGWLHEELFRTDWCPPTMAANWCASRLQRALLRLADAFGAVHVVAVPGNHGRLTKKPMAKGGADACFDHAIYEALADRLEADKRITFNTPAAGDCIIQVASTRYLVMHGHELGVKGGDGIIGALGPIMRGAIKTGRSERSIGRDFDVLVLGHFHQSIWQPRQGIIVNNSLKGWDEYARKSRFSYSPPAQWLWFSHPRFGPNLPFDVFLEDPPARDAVAFCAMIGAAP